LIRGAGQGSHIGSYRISDIVVDSYLLYRPYAILKSVRKTTIAIDDEIAAEAGRALHTKGLTATVNQSMREVVAMAARRRFVERLRTMEGMDLGDPDVMSQAWS